MSKRAKGRTTDFTCGAPIEARRELQSEFWEKTLADVPGNPRHWAAGFIVLGKHGALSA